MAYASWSSNVWRQYANLLEVDLKAGIFVSRTLLLFHSSCCRTDSHLPNKIPCQMATTDAQQTSHLGTAVVLAPKNVLGIVNPLGLERPLCSLAENVQRVMGAFYDVHKALLVSTKVQKAEIERFRQTKGVFRTECESLRQVLQGAYRHAVDFATSCQRAPNDRFISAKRCQTSGKGVLRDLQAITKAYDRNLEEFRPQQSILTGYLMVKKRNGSRPSSVASHDAVPHPETTVIALFAALEDIESSLRDLLAFWDNHATFLTLVVNRQSNFPSPGDETKATVELWVRYQAAILQTSSSISQSADAMSVDPSITPLNRNAMTTRRHTHPSYQAAKHPEPTPAPSNGQIPKTDHIKSDHSSFSRMLDRFLSFFGLHK
ncbi:hypothetical protein GALMADRAFT_1300736 [Galerina marginata CBS 339.88]|uniref:Uncharacterized protein n=1 Tax=Galerina marginata (strain CBS 339.88) TaxID=685588 RepID=A0A067T6W3_GALM3|nr:hypothetical protein GALMADRAFT_1300736 [Galerina marginata CBS 339.88]